MFRQGDLLFLKLEDGPDWFLGCEPRRSIVVAEGEVTGHKHVLQLGERLGIEPTELMTDDGLEFFRIVGANGVLTHPEHSTIEMPPGDYKLVRQREYEPGHAPRVVLD